ncbi:MAG TPA: VCBS repeat-containing protein [Candidatus Acidoferrales bacterium]|nr:VCBS repeat-containing protein [Candidatus Acidoferrales bacterium]
MFRIASIGMVRAASGSVFRGACISVVGVAAMFCGASIGVFLAASMLGGCAALSSASGAGQFTQTELRTDRDPQSIAVVDLNHDGKLDIVVANPIPGTVSVFLGDGAGHFQLAPGSPFSAGAAPSDIGVGDFNGDGNLDLIAPNTQTPYVSLFLGDGKGGFHPAAHSPLATKSYPHPHGVAVGHFCGSDKPLDAMIDSWGNSQVELLIGDGAGNLTNGPMFPAGPGSDLPLRSADFNRDGLPDIVMPDTAIGHWNVEQASVLLGDGKCGFRAAQGSPFPAGAVPWSVAIGDMNGDRNPDFVITPYGAQVKDKARIAATILVGDGKGGFAAMSGSPFRLTGCDNPGNVATGDFNGDGVRDFVVTCMGSDDVLLFQGKKTGGYALTTVAVAGGRGELINRGVALTDLTGSGREDILVSGPSSGTITILHVK